MKFVPQKDLGSIVHPDIIYYSLLYVNSFYHSTNTLEIFFNFFLKHMVNEHVFINLVSLGKKFSPR